MAEAVRTTIGRLMMREEGVYWNAYYTVTGKVEDGTLLGSIRMTIIVNHPQRKNTFLRLMKQAVGDLIQEATGQRPTWDSPKKAPEHERTKRA